MSRYKKGEKILVERKSLEPDCLYGDAGIITGADENGNLTFKQSEPDD